MSDATGGPAETPPQANTLFIEVTGAGLPEVDGLYVPSTAPPQTSESGTLSSAGFWNGKRAWDRADGRAERSPAISYSNSYRSWRICRLDGHLAYDFTTDEELPPTDREWHVYKKGEPPAPTVSIHYFDPREPVPSPTVVFVLGGPGTGKGTMCELAALQLGWTHLSVGDLLRRQIAADDSAGLGALLADGQLADDATVVSLLSAAMERASRQTGRTHFLLDGFPRSPGNLQAWREVSAGGDQLPRMLYFECPVEVLEQRILSRAKYTGRSDDNLAALQNRLETFAEQTLPTVDVFRAAGRCVEIDAGRDRGDVFADMTAALAEEDGPVVEQRPLSERAEMLLGLRPFPKKPA